MEKLEAHSLMISDYNYILPDDRIAKYPLQERSNSKLLSYSDGLIETFQFSDIASLVPKDSLMIFNNTKVIHARLFFRKLTGAVIEVFCLSPIDPVDYQLSFGQRGRVVWSCMIGNAKKWKDDSLQMNIDMHDEVVTLSASKISSDGVNTQVEFAWNNDKYTFSELLEEAGKLPIPPYLNRESELKDDETYQTVYSKIEGSVAAPTAGLHFTPSVMSALHDKGVQTMFVTLHVGAGTFKPVKSETMGGHNMHAEFIVITRSVVQSLLDNIENIIVVGTTSMRTIESLYYVGKQIMQNPSKLHSRFLVSQWEPYEEQNPISPAQALEAIIEYMELHGQDSISAETEIIIVPGYSFKYAKGIVTNFHQPESTLLLLISAFVGGDWKKIYDYALENDFRFLSYGDSSILWRH